MKLIILLILCAVGVCGTAQAQETLHSASGFSTVIIGCKAAVLSLYAPASVRFWREDCPRGPVELYSKTGKPISMHNGRGFMYIPARSIVRSDKPFSINYVCGKALP